MNYFCYKNVIVLLALAIVNTPSLIQAYDDLEKIEELAFRQAAAKVNSSVVRIQVIGGRDRVGNVLIGNASTTGLIVSKDGYIISSAFNFISKPSSILIELSDGRRFPAKRIGTDFLRMLTLLKIQAKELPVIKQPDKISYRVGQWAIGVGKSYQSEIPNISVGIISALNRISGKAIQTDAKISPVNYGGPLINVNGDVLGVLVPLASDTTDEAAGVEWYDSGIGFAIPYPDVLDSYKKLKQGKDLHRGFIGIRFHQQVPIGSPAKIITVRGNSPAEKNGLLANDLITEIDGHKVHRLGEARRIIGNYYSGDQIAIVVARGSKPEIKKITLTMVEKLVPFKGGFLGILPLRDSSNEEPVEAGVLIRYLFPGSPADKAGIKTGDRILKINDKQVDGIDDLLGLISRLPTGEKIKVTFERAKKSRDVTLVLSPISVDLPDNLSPLIIPSPDQEEVKEEVKEDKEEKDGEGDVKEENPDEIKTGHFRFKVKEHAHSCWAYVPDDYNPDYSYGLMVWLHPAGLTMEASMLEDWKGICDRRGLILLAPLMADKKGWSVSEVKFVEEATRNFIKKYSVAPHRVILHSFDDSAPFSYYALFKNRDLFHGGLFTNAPLKKAVSENDDDYRLQFYLSGQKSSDKKSSLKKTYDFLKGVKYPTRFDTYDSKQDEYPSSNMLNKYEIWIDTLDRL